MTDITKILEQAFADSGGVVGKAYLLDAKAEIERLRENRDYWMKSCQEAQESRDTASVLRAAAEADSKRLRTERDAYSNEITGTLMPEIERLRGLLREWLDMNRLIREGKPIPMNFIESRVREALGNE